MTRSTDWYDDDTFWDVLAPLLFSERRLLDAVPEVEALESLLEISPGSHILDLCCGVARHSLEFTRRGYRVTGVDRTGKYLEQARKQAKEEGLTIDFVEEDIRNFCRPKTFDCAVNLFTSFGYFEDPEDDRKVIRNMYTSLKPGGRFLIDVMGKEVLAQVFQERDWRETEDFILLEERKISRNWSWIENRWITFRGTERRGFRFGHRLYSAVELSNLMSDCGFGSVDVFGDLTGEPYDTNARRLVVVGRR
jgi:SAM-dependent methyltransferase